MGTVISRLPPQICSQNVDRRGEDKLIHQLLSPILSPFPRVLHIINRTGKSPQIDERRSTQEGVHSRQEKREKDYTAKLRVERSIG